MGLFISPLVSIESQVECNMDEWGIKYISLTRTSASNLTHMIMTETPHMLITNVETLTTASVQRAISRFQLSYIALEECQVNCYH